MAHLKKQLLEYLIRECICEVLDQADEVYNTDKNPVIKMHEQTLRHILENLQIQVKTATELSKMFKEPLYKTLADQTSKIYASALMKNPKWSGIHKTYKKLEELSFQLAKKYGINDEPGFLNDSYETVEEEIRLGMQGRSHFDLRSTCYNYPGIGIDEETVGAPAPPADGLGTADQPPIPYDKKKINELKVFIKRLIREAFSK